MGLGFPGGAVIDRLAREGDPEAFEFPVGMRRADSLEFSFSGLKTALVYAVRDLGPAGTETRRADLAASFQRAVVSQLMAKLEQGIERTGAERVAVGGGVAANSELRAKLDALCAERGVALKIPPPALCTDNAAMIASAARFVDALAYPAYLDLDVYATGERLLVAR